MFVYGIVADAAIMESITRPINMTLKYSNASFIGRWTYLFIKDYPVILTRSLSLSHDGVLIAFQILCFSQTEDSKLGKRSA